jgi:histone acetyltransferase MYST1
VLDRQDDQAYVHYLHKDKRLDEWLPELSCRLADPQPASTRQPVQTTSSAAPVQRKRARGAASPPPEPASLPDYTNGHTPDTQDGVNSELLADEPASLGALVDTGLSEEEFDMLQHKQIGMKRNFEKVHFGQWEIKTWYATILFSRRMRPFSCLGICQVLVTISFNGGRG